MASLSLDDVGTLGERFAARRVSTPGVLLRLVPDHSRVWSLAAILPA